jgi:hypothetical protein
METFSKSVELPTLQGLHHKRQLRGGIMTGLITITLVAAYIVCAIFVAAYISDEGYLDGDYNMGGGILLIVGMAVSPLVMVYWASRKIQKQALSVRSHTSGRKRHVMAALILTTGHAAILFACYVAYAGANNVYTVYAAESSARELAERQHRMDNLRELGLTGARQLKAQPIVGLNGQISGSMFFLSASLQGLLQTEPLLVVTWRNNEGVEYNSTIPYRMFRVETDESLTVPTIEFLMDTEKMHLYKEKYQYLPSVLIKNYMLMAKVRISTEVKQREIYLPR